MRDGRKAFLGSQGLRKNELDSRREIGVLVKDPSVVKRIAEVFAEDWAETDAGKKKAKKEDKKEDKKEEKAVALMGRPARACVVLVLGLGVAAPTGAQSAPPRSRTGSTA